VAAALAAIAVALVLPAYNDYVLRTRLATALEALQRYSQRLQEHRRSAVTFADATGCALKPPVLPGFMFTCIPAAEGARFSADVQGSGALRGYRYGIDERGQQRTLAHPHAAPNAACWSIAGSGCDYEP
jgi:type IV pilus assembly protein PilE